MKLPKKVPPPTLPPLRKDKGQCPRRFPALRCPWSQLTCWTPCIFRFTVDKYVQVSWKIEFFLCKSQRRLAKWLVIKKKWVIPFIKINSWNHVGLLCTVSSVLRTWSEVRINKSEQTDAAHHFFSFIDMHWRIKPFGNIWKSFWNMYLNV